MDPDAEVAAVAQVVERLGVRFPHVERDRVQSVVDRLHRDYQASPIREFIPILIEHEARDVLARMSVRPHPTAV